MKVLFPLHLFYPSKIGGPANTLYWLCKALVRKGHGVTVVSTKGGIEDGRVELDKWTDVEGIRVRYCGVDSKFPLDVVRYSIKELKNVDAVVFSSICFMPNFIVALAAMLKGKKIVWSPRGELFASAVQGNKGKKLYFRMLRLLAGKKILFHATSKEEAGVIKNYFPDSKVVIIPNYMEMPEKEEFNADYSHFVYVGRIAPIKALDKLVEGLGMSERFRASDYKMVIVGGVEAQFEAYNKDLQHKIEQLCLSDKVVFVGSKSGKEKFREYASARYSFLVSDSENFGNVVIEALSQGTPIVASQGTPWSQLEKEKAGFWIENTPEMIAQTVNQIIEQTNEEYIEYRVNALRLSKSFDVFEHVEEWENVLTFRNNKAQTDVN